MQRYDGRPQRYGENFECSADGQMEPSPIDAPEHLNERRAEIGLLPMRLYRKVLLQMYPADFCRKAAAAPR